MIEIAAAFSLAIISSVVSWRSSSAAIAAFTSGSVSASELLSPIAAHSWRQVSGWSVIRGRVLIYQSAGYGRRTVEPGSREGPGGHRCTERRTGVAGRPGVRRD